MHVSWRLNLAIKLKKKKTKKYNGNEKHKDTHKSLILIFKCTWVRKKRHQIGIEPKFIRKSILIKLDEQTIEKVDFLYSVRSSEMLMHIQNAIEMKAESFSMFTNNIHVLHKVRKFILGKFMERPKHDVIFKKQNVFWIRIAIFEFRWMQKSRFYSLSIVEKDFRKSIQKISDRPFDGFTYSTSSESISFFFSLLLLINSSIKVN